MYKEVEEVSFLPGESILNKKEVYEPTKRQRFRQVVCTKSWAVAILVMIGVVIVGVAVIAAFARPAATCDLHKSDATAAAGSGSVGGGDTEEAQTFKATNGEEFPWRDVRLPKTLVPQSYDIFLHPNLTKSEFSGTVKMVLRVMEETDVVMFHIKGLIISEIEAKLGSSGDASSTRFDQPVAIKRQLEYTTHEQYYVQLAERLSAGSYVQIMVKFSGKFKEDNMQGFYPSSYTVNGEKRIMANTQFESTYAREAFPCWDEPALKATFKLSIVRETRQTTLFNMPLLKTTPYEGSLLLDEYDTSVKMSTYLVAFVVFDFKYLSATTSSGTLVRVFAPEDKVYMGQFALDTAVTVLENYTSFFGHSYKLPKADLVAIPNFEAGAMENWGLITYRDTALLYDPAVANHRVKKYVALVVAHEVAHQWFGNLVTMEWWDDLWLNEGFATFVQFIGMDAVDHSFDGQISLSLYYTDALYMDGLANSHPIKVPLKDPSEIAAVFDSISYDKGAAIIRMLESVIGRESMKKGLKNYLEEHSFGNAVTQDLWRAWQQVSPVKEISVPAMMDTWTLQMGYPVVTVSWTDQSVSLRQERFLLTKRGAGEEEEEKYKSPFGYQWIIPFTYCTSARPSQQELVFLKEKSMEIPFPGNGDGDSLVWLKANKDLRGFYRVNYEPKGWAKLAEQLKKDHSVFSISDRIGLLDDAFNLARSGLVNYTVVLELVQYLSQETSRYVWTIARDHLFFLAHRLALEQEYDLIREMVLSFVRPLLNTLGSDDTGDLSTRQLRNLLIRIAVHFEDKAYVDKVLMVFEDWKKNESAVMNNDLRSLVYKTGVKYGTKADWDLVFDRYTKAKAASERESLLLSLPSSRDARVLQILLEFSMDTSKIKSQDTSSIFSLVARNPNGLLLAWRFLRQNWDFFFTRYGETSSILRGMVKIVSHFNTQFDLDEVNTFFQDKTLGSAEQPLKQSLEVVEDHMTWTKTHQETVKTWLRDNIPSPGSYLSL